MSSQIELVVEMIEKLRCELNEMGNGNNLLDIRVLELSEKLDILINRYNELISIK